MDKAGRPFYSSIFENKLGEFRGQSVELVELSKLAWLIGLNELIAPVKSAALVFFEALMEFYFRK